MKKRRLNDSALFSLLMIFIGGLLASFAVACIILPNDALDYGTAGIAIIISKLSGINLSVCVVMVMIPFLTLGLVFMGRNFCTRACFGALVYTIGLELFEKIPFVLNTEHFVAVAFGGAILGFGLSLILRFGGCIDGSEILANILVNRLHEKKNRQYSLTGFLIAFNACVYLAVYVLIDRTSALLSLLVYVVATIVTDHFTDRFEAIKQVTIITKNPEQMIERIYSEMNKTCTVIDSSGVIAGTNKTLICYVSYFELQQLREIMEDFADSAFITVSTIDEIIKK